MNECKQWQDQLLDHALGQPASPELEAHLASCKACSATLDAGTSRASHLDAGIRQFMAAQPPLGLAAQILSCASSQRVKPAFAWRWRVAVAGLACAAALIAMVYYRGVSLRKAREQERLLVAATTISHWQSPTATLLYPPSQGWLNEVPHLGNTFFVMKPVKGLSREEK